MKRSKRFEVLENRPIHEDGFVKEWPEVGMIAMDSPNDPIPSVRIENGKIVEMDGKERKDFDMIDSFIADYSINLDNAERVAKMDSVLIARKICDINITRDEILDISLSMTPAKMNEVVCKMSALEIMMGLAKMRARISPSNQAHVTNLKDNPAQLAADAAEGSLRGFDEEETTVGISRYAPMNAISILIGSQTGRPGVLTQCSVEEATELGMGMRGFTTYAETVSVYGTEQVFMDGDDTPFSKAFLASCYASRGLKMRFTSGTGSEVQMGFAEGKSMLYLEARCVFITKGAGSQGIQNGSVSCCGVPAAVPSGIKAMGAENLFSTLLDLECASSNDQSFTHSDLRRSTRTMMQFMPGTDFICSGYSSVPNYDNMFAGGNWDAEDFDDWLVIQRDLKIDGGLKPVREENVIKIRNKAAKAIQATFKGLGLPAITDEEVEAATYSHGSKDMPKRNVNADLKAIEEMMESDTSAVDIIKALYNGGFKDVADAVFNMQKQKVAGDYLQTAAILTKDFHVVSAVNAPNDYQGPQTGYQISDERWNEMKDIPWAVNPEDY
ncbi:MAG: propanediol/glycerol family dehydratase large subunit [Peptostreptococcaceae bacterium]|nr:propanediol/glycerol family dehydratase large subunit [Peptostreptococcaceae bacterium]